MEVYLQAFVNFEQNDWAKFLPIAEFIYNNVKNTSTSHTPFKLNCEYYSCVSFEKDVEPRSRLMSTGELLSKLRKLMSVCHKNLFYAQELQKQANNKGVKPKSYVLDDKIWLNSKYIKTKQNWKLEAKFFGPFQVLHPMAK